VRKRASVRHVVRSVRLMRLAVDLEMSRFLVWCYKFPPEAGVGARRWYKFTKYLARRGHEVVVVTPPICDANKDSYAELDSDNVTVLRLNGGRSTILCALRRVFPIADRVLKRLDRLMRRVSANAYDEAFAWAKGVAPDIDRLISQRSIEVLVATGHPCSLNYWATYVKKDYPNVILIQDFRDLWNSEENYSVERLGERVKSASVKAETLSLECADIVYNVSPRQSSKMRLMYAGEGKKFHVLPNGIDPEDYRAVEEKNQGEGIRIVHAGTIRWNAIQGLAALHQAVADMSSSLADRGIEFHFYGASADMESLVAESGMNHKFFRSHGVRSPREVAQAISRCDGGLIIFDKSTGYSTKIFEYMGLSKPFLAICPYGELYEFCLNNGMYAATYDVQQICEQLKRICEEWPHDVHSIPDWSQFQVSKLVKQIEDDIAETTRSHGRTATP